MLRAAIGFTLLEILVALAILAIALAAVLKTTTESISHAGYLRDKTFANWVAMNVITAMRLEKELPETGKREGTAEMANRQWAWEANILSTLDKDLRRVEVTVYTAPDSQIPLLKLTGFIGAS